MSPERWQQINSLFLESLEISPSERGVFLNEVCPHDPELRVEVEKLINAHQKVDRFIETPVLQAVAPLFANAPVLLKIGQHIGPYQIESEIGQGGMGTVYLGARADNEYRKQVAIKVIRPGMNSEMILRRFRNERQILASLDHANIGRLLEGGTTTEGLPYFVMEYIEGITIDKYCSRHNLSIDERLKLFRSICNAVHYAHKNLIIHRDIKPKNILVTSNGEAKLLDFGIAKILNTDTVASDQLTETAQRIMTPEYASPEQVRGQPMTTTSDIYTLGVLLYELLTGIKPYQIQNYTPLELERVICQIEPEKPSLAVIAGRRPELNSDKLPIWMGQTGELSRQNLRRRLAGDLDNIVLKSLQKEPSRRYSSADQLSEDIRRHLQGLTVLARPDTFSYRFGKFVNRNKVGVSVALGMLFLLIGGIGGILWQAHIAETERDRAERRFTDVRQIADSLLFEFNEDIEKLPGATLVRQKLISRGLNYLDNLAQEAGDDPALLRELGTAYKKLGDIQGNMGDANLGNTGEALHSYQKGLALFEKANLIEPPDRSMQLQLATVYASKGDVLVSTGKIAPAREEYLKALPLLRRLASDPMNIAARHELAVRLNRFADVLSYNTDYKGARTVRQEAVTVAQSLIELDKNDLKSHLELSQSLRKLGSGISTTGDLNEALEYMHQAIKVDEELVAEYPDNAQVQRSMALSYELTGSALALTDTVKLEEVLFYLKKALTIREQTLNKDPANAQAHRDVSVSYFNIANTIAATDPHLALDYYLKALKVDEHLSQYDPKNQRAKLDLGWDHITVGDLMVKMKDIAGGIKHLRQAVRILLPLYEQDVNNSMARTLSADALYVLAKQVLKTGAKNEAENLCRQSLQIRKAICDRPDVVISELYSYGLVLLTCELPQFRDMKGAMPYLLRAVKISNGTNAKALRALSLAYHLKGNNDLATQTAQQALTNVKDKNSPLAKELASWIDEYRGKKRVLLQK